LEIRVFISVDCEVASRGLCGVWETQGSAVPGLEVGGVGVRMRISSLDITLSGSYGIRLAPVNPPWIFFSVIEVKNASLNAQRNSSLLMCVMFICINCLIWQLYAFFNGPKQLISNG